MRVKSEDDAISLSESVDVGTTQTCYKEISTGIVTLHTGMIDKALETCNDKGEKLLEIKGQEILNEVLEKVVVPCNKTHGLFYGGLYLLPNATGMWEETKEIWDDNSKIENMKSNFIKNNSTGKCMLMEFGSDGKAMFGNFDNKSNVVGELPGNNSVNCRNFTRDYFCFRKLYSADPSSTPNLLVLKPNLQVATSTVAVFPIASVITPIFLIVAGVLVAAVIRYRHNHRKEPTEALGDGRGPESEDIDESDVESACYMNLLYDKKVSRVTINKIEMPTEKGEAQVEIVVVDDTVQMSETLANHAQQPLEALAEGNSDRIVITEESAIFKDNVNIEAAVIDANEVVAKEIEEAAVEAREGLAVEIEEAGVEASEGAAQVQEAVLESSVSLAEEIGETAVEATAVDEREGLTEAVVDVNALVEESEELGQEIEEVEKLAVEAPVKDNNEINE